MKAWFAHFWSKIYKNKLMQVYLHFLDKFKVNTTCFLSSSMDQYHQIIQISISRTIRAQTMGWYRDGDITKFFSFAVKIVGSFPKKTVYYRSPFPQQYMVGIRKHFHVIILLLGVPQLKKGRLENTISFLIMHPWVCILNTFLRNLRMGPIR